MGLLTPVAVKVGSIPWLPRYLPQIVIVDKAIQRVSRGRLALLDIAGLPSVTMHVRGRKSGAWRSTNLLAAPVGEEWIIAGSYFGGASTPQWVFNVRAADRVVVEGRGGRGRGHQRGEREYRPRELSGPERAEAWQELRAVWPNFDLYEKRTERTIPVFLLEPV
ncbi:nitroreductase family deazaflavin-dependent oxidoreductase [Dietzia sp.]|uniref:nitroreductase family deazaflavin-dependent oxidoreductase n=1 Tax=Dietzia sp. TaxID=1871616 RepID=UPI002FD99B60